MAGRWRTITARAIVILAAVFSIRAEGCVPTSSSGTSSDSSASSGSSKSEPYVLVVTNAGTQYRWRYSSFEWYDGTGMMGSYATITLKMSDCTSRTFSRDDLRRIGYGGKSQGPCSNSVYTSVVINGSQGWHAQSPAVRLIIGTDLDSGQRVSVNLTELNEAVFYK
jgi:hypothetical protein